MFTARYVLPKHCICVFCVDLRTNSDYVSGLLPGVILGSKRTFQDDHCLSLLQGE